MGIRVLESDRNPGPKDAYYGTNLAVFEMIIGRIGGQPRILKRFSDGEMVETLIVIVAEAKDFMNGVIKKTADPGASDAVGFSFQIEHLSDHSGFPEQMPVAVRCRGDNLLEF